MARALIIKLGIIAVALAILQYAWAALSGFKDTPTPVRLLDQYLDEHRDVIYFGDSTLFTVDPVEADKAHLNEMVQRLAPEWRVGGLAFDAYHLGLYEYFCTYIARKPLHPRAVIIPINLATLSPYWENRPAYQFERVKLFLKHDSKWFRAFYRPLATFRAFKLNPVDPARYRQTPIRDGFETVGTVESFTSPKYEVWSEKNAHDQIIMRYMASLTDEDPNLQAMRRIVRALKSVGIQMVFYITPVDYETCVKYMGDRFRDRIRENVAVIQAQLREEGETALDLTLDLPASAFWWGATYPNEHLNQTGRLYVAQQITGALKKRLEAKP